MAKFQDVFMSSGIVETANLLKQQLNQKEPTNGADDGKGTKSSNRGKSVNMNQLNKLMSKASTSELTVYRNAIERKISKRMSSSSDEENNKTNSIDLCYGVNDDCRSGNTIIDNFIADARDRYERSQSRERRTSDDDPR